RQPYWKLTCFCGKVLLAAADGPHTQGRCPKCGRSLLFPTDQYITTGVLPIIPAGKSVSFKKRTAGADRVNSGHSAADNAADKLRPGSARAPRSATGLVSAWPVADRASR